ncbi:MAG: oligosaccharide flippase family protein, partial [Myxococcales bacterium]|nr:oligosaccharide flippase family protein [Myxococcales bacterium]
MSLKKKTIDSAAWFLIGSVGIKVVSITTFFVLAALLDTRAFGTVAIVNAIIQFGDIFVNAGMCDALIQRRKLRKAHINAVFFMSVGLGLLLFASLFALSSFLAVAYGDKQLTSLIRVASLAFFVQPLATTSIALLRREFHYKTLVSARVIGISSGSGVGLLAAILGLGVWSLVLQNLTWTVVSAVLSMRGCTWRPNWKVDREAIIDILSFSSQIFLDMMLATITRILPSLTIGYLLGLEAAGIYLLTTKIVESTVDVINQPITTAVLSSFTLLQDNKEKLIKTFCRVLENAFVLLIPVAIGTAFLLPPLIHTTL